MNDATSAQQPDEATALLHSNTPAHAQANSRRPRIFAYTAPILIALIALGAALFTKQPSLWISGGRLPDDPREAADVILSGAPVIVRSACLPFVLASWLIGAVSPYHLFLSCPWPGFYFRSTTGWSY
jgi:hypothetical protein